MSRDADITRRDDRRTLRSDSGNPFRRFADEVDRFFDEGLFGRGRTGQRRGLLGDWGSGSDWEWAPEVEVFNREDQLVIRADLPGLTKDDVRVDITDDRVTIEGERRREHQETRDGVFHSERSYGNFCRIVQLPPGAMADQAKASFKDGVLQVVMPTPPESSRRRRLEISETSPAESPVVTK